MEIIGINELDYFLKKRYGDTLRFLKKNVAPPCKVLDLGTTNKLSELMTLNGYTVSNTQGEDFDTEYQKIKEYDADLTTSFEVFEHLLAPYNILKEIKTPKLVASIPLKMWFAEAYWNEADERDRHFHEFEKKQFDWLLEKTGWKVLDSALWTAPVRVFGIRPILRMFVPRYYIVYCERAELSK
ncbi:MAG: methyltransferase [Bacteroidota bacterium]